MKFWNKSMRYYDFLSLESLNVDETTEAFIVANPDETYSLRLVPEGTLKSLSCDMLGRQTTYWPINLPLTSPDKIAKLLPDGELRGAPLSHDEVISFFGLDPRNIEAKPFKTPRQTLRFTRNEDLESIISSVFRNWGVLRRPLPSWLTHAEERTSPEWVSINTNVLNGHIFSKENFDSLANLSRSKYSTFSTPYTSKNDVLSELKNVTKSSFKLFVYLCLSVSAIDFLLTSLCFLRLWHDKIPVEGSNLNENMRSSSLKTNLKVALYSTLLDSLFTVVNPFVSLLSLFVRSGTTIAFAMSNNQVENETYVEAIPMLVR